MTQSSKTLINGIIQIHTTKDATELSALTNTLSKAPKLVQYYIIKGFKLASLERFYEFTAFAKTTESSEPFFDIIRDILKELYVEEDNYAYEGKIGSVEEFADYYRSILGSSVSAEGSI